MSAAGSTVLYSDETKISDDIGLEEFVLRRMKKDDLKDIVTGDDLLLTYGSFLLSGKGTKKANYISQNTRLVARLTEALRKRIPDQANGTLTKLLLPENFDAMVDCTKKIWLDFHPEIKEERQYHHSSNHHCH